MSLCVRGTKMKIEYLKDGNVVALDSARRTLKFPAIAQIEAYWHGVRNGRLMPARSDINPRGIGDQLPHAFVLERIAPGHARIRLAGQQINEILSMEVRGMPLTALFAPAARAEIQETLERAFDMPAEVNLTLKNESGLFQKSLSAQMILLPLKDHKGLVTRMLGALQVDGDLTRGPHRFTIQTLDVRPLMVDPTPAQIAHDAARRQKREMTRPGYWDMRGADRSKTSEADKEASRSSVTRVDIRPARASEGKTSEGHIMRPSGHGGVPVPGLAELAASFDGARKPPHADAQMRPGGHLRLVPQD